MWLSAVGLLQFAVVAAAFSNPGNLLSSPIANDDSTGHFYSALHAIEHWRRAGKLWGYDPYWMAGYPEGIAALVDNRLFAAIVSLAPHGAEASAYNTAFILAMLSPPWLLYGAARMSRESRAAATGAALAATIASFTVPLTAGFLAWGGISFFLASALAVPATVALAGATASGGLLCARGIAGLGLTFAALFVHPAVLPALAAGLVPAFLAGRRRPAGLVVDAVLIAIVLAIVFLPVLEIYADLRGQLQSNFDPNAVFLRNPRRGIMSGGLAQLHEDWWTYLLRIDGGPHGAGGLLALVLLAISGARSGEGADVAASSARRLQRWVIACATGASFLLAYVVSSVLPRARAFEPHRFIMVLGFLLCLPAGRALARCLVRGRGSLWRTSLASVTVAIALHAGFRLTPLRVFGVGWDPAEDALVGLLQTNGDSGRTLVESDLSRLPAAAGAERTIGVKRFALLPLKTGREFLGYYFTGAQTAERYASFRKGGLFGHALADLDDAGLAGLLRRFAVTRVVACDPQTLRIFHRFAATLEQEASLGDCVAFRVREADPSRLLEGRGEVRATLDRIEVRAAEGERLVLKYHWLPTLRTEPPLPIEEAPQPRAPVGFIAVRPGGRRDFDIVERRSGGMLRPALAAVRALLGL